MGQEEDVDCKCSPRYCPGPGFRSQSFVDLRELRTNTHTFPFQCSRFPFCNCPQCVGSPWRKHLFSLKLLFILGHAPVPALRSHYFLTHSKLLQVSSQSNYTIKTEVHFQTSLFSPPGSEEEQGKKRLRERATLCGKSWRPP